jgi:hypothetical protein
MTKDQLYKEVSKRLQEDGPNAYLDDLIDMSSSDNLENSRQTRDLLDQFVGNQMMKNTSLPIDLSSDKKVKKTLEGLTSQYTDIKNPKWDVYDIGKDTVGGLHTDGTFGANSRYIDEDVVGQLAAHEPLHKMVRDSGGKSTPDNILSKFKKMLMKEQNIISGEDLAKKGALAGHEIMQAGHLNPNSKITSSLKNAIDAASGNFSKLKLSKIPFVGPAIAGGLTLAATGDASAAAPAAIPILNEAETLGPTLGPESDIENPSKSYEQRKKAIEMLSQRRD